MPSSILKSLLFIVLCCLPLRYSSAGGGGEPKDKKRDRFPSEYPKPLVDMDSFFVASLSEELKKEIREVNAFFITKFKIKENGEICCARVLRNNFLYLPEASILRAFQEAPKWQPAYFRKKAVPYTWTYKFTYGVYTGL